MKRSAIVTALLLAGGALVAAAPVASAQPAPVAGPSCFTPAKAAGTQGRHGRDTRPVTKAVALEVDRQLKTAKVARLGPVEVPVYANIIVGSHAGDTAVTETQIADTITVLNDAYSGGQSASNMNANFHFTLMGTRTYKSDRAYHANPYKKADKKMRKKLRKGGKNALNLYFVKPNDGTLGWAAFPWEYKKHKKWDGVSINVDSVAGGSMAEFNLGDTATHEVGHWLGLYHTFQGGCDVDNDFVADTPAEAGPNYVCAEGTDTCAAAGLDPIHNFMDYTPDACMNMFTWGQTDRMTRAWAYFRAPAV